MSTSATSPASLFGGTWERIKDRFLLAAGDTYTAGDTGGEAAHTLTVNETPSHNHSMNGLYAGTGSNSGGTVVWDTISGGSLYGTKYAGGGAAHNNMPPYLAVYMWKRAA